MKFCLRFALLGVFFLLAVPLSPLSAAQVPSPWQGLWEITQETEAGPVTLHLWLPVSAGEATLSGADWLPLSMTKWSVQGDKIVFDWQTKGVSITFTGTRKGKIIEGGWRLIHPQFEVRKPFRGRHIHNLDGWVPLAFSLLPDSRTRIIDVAGDALSHIEAGTYEDFSAKYFALLGRVVPQSQMRQTTESASFKEKSARITEVLKDIVKRISDKFPGYALPIDVALLPVGEAVHSIYLQDRHFVAINPDKLQLPPGPVAQTMQLSRILFEQTLVEFIPDAPHPAFQLMRAALPLALTVALNITEDRGAILQMSNEAYEETRKRIPELKLELRKGNSPGKSDYQVLALAFGEFLGSALAPTRQEVFEPATIRKFFSQFISSPQ